MPLDINGQGSISGITSLNTVVSDAELARLDGVTSSIQEQISSKADYALSTNARTTTTYSFVIDDANRITSSENSSSVIFTVPPQNSVSWIDDTIIRVINYGSGSLSIVGGSGVTVTNTAKTLSQFESAAIIRNGENLWTLVPFSGGASDADFSNTATGTVTVEEINYKYVQFNSTGTLTVTQDGFASVLLIGGGASGGTGLFGEGANNNGAGGGAGAVFEREVFLKVGTYTATVGAGGAARTGNNQQGAAGSPSLLGSSFTGGTDGITAAGGSPNSGLTGGTSGMGFTGASGGSFSGGGGGGAGANAPAKPGGNTKGDGGAGVLTIYSSLGVSGRVGGGGQGAGAAGAQLSVDGGGRSDNGAGGDALPNSGAGGAGRYADVGRSGAGGSGVIIVRVKQN